MRRTAASAIAAALILTGCGANADKPAATSTTPTSPPADGGTYTDPKAILTALGTAVSCPNPHYDTPIGATAQVSCQHGAIIIRTYPDHDGVTQAVQLQQSVADRLGEQIALLTGRNWSFLGENPDAVTTAQQQIGGQIFTIYPQAG